MEYLLIFVFLLVAELLYFKIANHYNIIDKPNERSSHQTITLRGGGIVFALAVVLAYMLGYTSIWIAVSVLIVAFFSFFDDIRPLPALPRFLAQSTAVLLVLAQITPLETHYLWLIPVFYIAMVGWINTFNFMDGINGITVLYALACILSFACLPVHTTHKQFLIVVGLSCVVFGFFNLRKKAKAFAGDVGSVSMAIVLGYLMVQTIVETHNMGYILFFAVYGIDSVVTILYRIKRKENIFKAHRTHLYQYLANEKKQPHIGVAIGYAAVQLSINAVVIYLDKNNLLTSLTMVILLVVFLSIYLIVRTLVLKSIKTIC
jgi:UDP-N-acetylmuramyl pentapeptide phosphotransferase/UDP-N-acetylglucosamine-1-phosphate transferase